MPYNFAAESFHTRNFVADFLREKPKFLYGKWKKFTFEAPFGGQGQRTMFILGSLESL